MNRLELEAFIAGPATHDRVKRLNEAVHNRAILPIVGQSGSGKNRFSDWWAQEGCASAEFAEGTAITPDDIVLVNAQPSPVSSVPIACVVFTRLWRALQEIERARYNGEPRRVLGRVKPCTERHVLSVIDDNVLPLLDELMPQAIVVPNAQNLDKRTFSHLLELRSPFRRNRPRIALRALILCASVEDRSGEGSKFGKLLSDFGETRVAWSNRMLFPLPEGREFVAVMLRLIHQNLCAEVGDDVDEQRMYEDLAIWTNCNWWLMRELVIVLDRALGPRRDDRPRIITRQVLEQARQPWLERSGGPIVVE
jgi:hypothetical protein